MQTLATRTLLSAAATLLCWHVLFDTWFYWCHRALHHPSIYRFVHKQHHEFKEPTGIAAFYAHPPRTSS